MVKKLCEKYGAAPRAPKCDVVKTVPQLATKGKNRASLRVSRDCDTVSETAQVKMMEVGTNT
jgi:hypothetical protein